MKKVFSFILILAGCATAQAQTEGGTTASKPVRHIVRLVPQEFVVNTFRLDWEFRTGNRSSVQLSPSFTYAERSVEFGHIKGGGLEVAKKFYLREENVQLKGFYGAITGSFHRYTLLDDYGYDYYSFPGFYYVEPEEETVNRAAANLVLGYQFMIKEVVALDVFAGGGIRATNSRNRNNPDARSIFDPRYNGVAPKIGFSVGVVL